MRQRAAFNSMSGRGQKHSISQATPLALNFSPPTPTPVVGSGALAGNGLPPQLASVHSSNSALSMNSSALTPALSSAAASAAAAAGGSVQTNRKRTLYVRALFDFEPSADPQLPGRGLAFRYGQILHVLNASDDEWWQARHVLPDGSEDPSAAALGIVPSKRRCAVFSPLSSALSLCLLTSAFGPAARPSLCACGALRCVAVRHIQIRVECT